MKPRAKQPKYKIVEQCMKKLYERFDNKEIHLQQLLKQLSFLLQMENKLEFHSFLLTIPRDGLHV